MSTNEISLDEMLQRVEEVRPLIEGETQTTEDGGRMSSAVAQALRDADFYRLAYPKAVGGLDMSPPDLVRIWEAIARIDTAVAWNLLMTTSGVGMQLGRLSAEGIDRIFAERPPIAAGAAGLFCQARRVEGGFLVTGQVPYMSGAYEADLLGFGASIAPEDPDEPPDAKMMFVPAADAELLDTWHVLGMRGTGSVDLRLDDTFIAEHLASVHGLGEAVDPRFDTPTFRMWPMLSLIGEAIVSVACAEGAVELLVGLAAKKTPAYTATPLRDRELAQYQAGKARSRVDAARAFLYTVCDEGLADVQDGGGLDPETKLRIQLAICFAGEGCAEAGRLVFDAAGSSAFRTEFGFERALRDLQTMAQHADKSTPRYATAGRLMFGHENDWFFLAF